MEKQRAFSMMLSRGVIIASENDTADFVSRLMLDNDIGAVVVIRNEKLVGLVSERDVVRRVVAKGLDPLRTKVKEFMTKDVKVAEFKEGLNKIYQTLCQVKFRHLPIMDDGKLVGIASQRDVLYGLKPKAVKHR